MKMSVNSKQYDQLVTKLNHLIVSLSLDEKSTQELGTDINDTIKKYELKANAIKETTCELKSVVQEFDDKMSQMTSILDAVSPLLDKYESLIKLDKLLSELSTIKKIHKSLEMNVINCKTNKDFETKVTLITQSFNQMVDSYKDFEDNHKNDVMKNYLYDIIIYWKPIILTKLRQRFADTFESIDWPLINTNKLQNRSKSQSSEAINTFLLYFNSLLIFDIQCKRLSPQITTESEIVLPIDVMVTPLKKRFQYHFMETKSKLNRPEKPEWYLSQTLVWIRQNNNFLCETIDPLLLDMKSATDLVPAKFQLISGLLECVTTKLKSDLPSLVYDDKLFTHTVDEVLIFNRELLEIESNIIQVFPNCNLMNVFSSEPFFTRILSLERKKSTEFVELILDSKSAWNEICGPEGNDELKICECGDNFVLMLQSVTNRCSFFTNESLKYAFIKLQLEMLDDFRLRLIQLLHTSDKSWPLSQRYFAIINTINYLIFVLNEWKILPFYVQISEIYSPNETVFDQIIGLLQHVLNESIQQIKDLFLDQLKTGLQTYASIKWFCLKLFDNSLSSSASQLLHFISTNLVSLQKSLSISLFDKISQEMAQQLSRILVEDLVLENSFNDFGAKQLDYDITVGFLSLFRLYLSRPNAEFGPLIDAVKLVNIEKGTYLLLKEILSDRNKTNEAKMALKEMSVTMISTQMALNIIQNKIFDK
ncbi:RAD50-interacting protein 1-like [Oppia nitens]|uniref:RAD50-interacting protein 1-like n=1 Tax=Oppia nitens TaxID=1686743 RepID=UPI0023DB327C|nr:RAD50-interacting protein 1-like [Oppia nitens]